MRLIFIGILGCLLFGLSSAEGQTPTPEQLQKQIEIQQDEIAKLKAQLAASESYLHSKYQEAKAKEYDYQVRLMELNLETFGSQRTETYTVMGLVVLVVVSGLLFSAFQLWKSVGVAGVQLNSELEMSAKNVRVTSSIVGVVVLVISVVFLYIYTHEVYQIRFVNPYAPDISEPKQ